MRDRPGAANRLELDADTGTITGAATRASASQSYSLVASDSAGSASGNTGGRGNRNARAGCEQARRAPERRRVMGGAAVRRSGSVRFRRRGAARRPRVGRIDRGDDLWRSTAPTVAGTTNIDFTLGDSTGSEVASRLAYEQMDWLDITALASAVTITNDPGGWIEGPSGTWTAALTQGRLGFRYLGTTSSSRGRPTDRALVRSQTATLNSRRESSGTPRVIGTASTGTGAWAWTQDPAGSNPDRIEDQARRIRRGDSDNLRVRPAAVRLR